LSIDFRSPKSYYVEPLYKKKVTFQVFNPYPEEFPVTIPNKVLVVDDSAPLHQIYKIILMRYKFDVIQALSGQEGLDSLSQHPDISLLIVDLAMPKMSGLEFIKKVKEQAAFNKIAIIVVTSRSREIDSEEACAFAQGNLNKPFTSNELHALIEKQLFLSVA
jgi:DNA-binding response OmpR family regulator